jgi:protein-disulfide isomerase
MLAALLLPAVAWAGDTTALRPPAGASVALVAFEDLQCPDCAAADPLLLEAAAKYKIPLVRRDFPLPMHNWSFNAHVIARYFDTKSPELGEQFRRWVYANQDSIKKENLFGMASRFADQHKVELPENYDPARKLEKLVKDDFAFGQQIGVIHTPTVYVISLSQRGAPMIEELDRDKLFALVEKLQAAEQKK